MTEKITAAEVNEFFGGGTLLRRLRKIKVSAYGLKKSAYDILEQTGDDDIEFTVQVLLEEQMKAGRQFESMFEAFYPEMDEFQVRAQLDKARKFVNWAVDKVSQMKKGLDIEKQETKDMFQTFFRLLQQSLHINGNTPPTDDEIKKAIRQLKDVGKVALVAAVLLGPIPGDEPLLIGLEMLARKFGVSLLPSAMAKII